MRTQNLNSSASVILDSHGNGTASLGPGAPGHVWHPSSVSINMTGQQPPPNIPGQVSLVTVYAGNSVAANSLIDSTYNVNSASSSMIDGLTLYPGQLIWAVWNAGNPGATATLNVYGERRVP